MGDFNQWGIVKALEDFPDLSECPVGNTRGGNSIDKIITNLFPNMSQCGTVPPLEPDLPGEGSPSDHRISYLKCLIPKVRKFKWLSYSYRYLNEESTENFKKWVVLQDWSPVLYGARTSQQKALAYQTMINEAVSRYFPLITMRRKSTDPVSYTHLTLPTIYSV